MKDLGIANQTINMGLGKKISRRCHQQHLRTHLVQREFDGHINLFLDFFFKAFQRIDKCGSRQTEVIPNFVHLADDFVGILLPNTDRGQNFASGHRNLCRIDTEGAVNRTTSAFGTLMVVTIPVINDFLGQLGCADQFRKVLAGDCEITTIDAA